MLLSAIVWNVGTLQKPFRPQVISDETTNMSTESKVTTRHHAAQSKARRTPRLAPTTTH